MLHIPTSFDSGINAWILLDLNEIILISASSLSHFFQPNYDHLELYGIGRQYAWHIDYLKGPGCWVYVTQ